MAKKYDCISLIKLFITALETAQQLETVLETEIFVEMKLNSNVFYLHSQRKIGTRRLIRGCFTIEYSARGEEPRGSAQR